MSVTLMVSLGMKCYYPQRVSVSRLPPAHPSCCASSRQSWFPRFALGRKFVTVGERGVHPEYGTKGGFS